MFRDKTVRIIPAHRAGGIPGHFLDLYIFGNLPLTTALRQGVFTAISGLCTCGLQNSNPHLWAAIPLAIIAMMMFIGGAMGSSAGGVKVNRVMLVYDGVKWWFRRFFVSSRVLVPFKSGGRTYPQEISELAISKNLLVMVLYVTDHLYCNDRDPSPVYHLIPP